jgi:hypothetical protein
MGGFWTLSGYGGGEEKFWRAEESNPDRLLCSLVTILTELFRLSVFGTVYWKESPGEEKALGVVLHKQTAHFYICLQYIPTY